MNKKYSPCFYSIDFVFIPSYIRTSLVKVTFKQIVKKQRLLDISKLLVFKDKQIRNIQ